MSKRSFIPYGRQRVYPEDIRAVVRVLRSDRLTQGPVVEKFEEAFAKYVGAPYAVSVSSGTGALHLGALAAGFGPGDEIITSPMTFVASANCILYTGATPRFVDIDDVSLGLKMERVCQAVGTATRGIVSVDFAGHPCPLGPKEKLSKRKDFIVIEDACHALGAERLRGSRWVKAGACLEEDMAIFSFHPVKHITTGEGGMVTTRRRDLYEKIRLLRSHGIEKDPKKMKDIGNAGKPWFYEMQELGFNYRMTDFQCALGLSQLKKADAGVRRRREIATYYSGQFSSTHFLKTPYELEGCRSSYHLYSLRLDFKALGRPRERVMAELRQRGIGTQVHYIPVTSQPYYREKFAYPKNAFPAAQAYYEETLSIPLFASLTDADAKKVVSEIKKLGARRCR